MAARSRPDICPATLATLTRARTALENQADEVQVIMITVDPEGDEPAELNRYVRRFDPTFIGLSGSATSLQSAWEAFGIYSERRDLDRGGYLIDHTATVLVLDRAGALRLAYPFNTPAADIHADWLRLLTE